MIELRHGHERGHADHGWLDSRHSFSFADYYDPTHMGVSALRVINDDRVEPGQGFDTHPHRDMEILSYILAGSIEHRDTLGFHTRLEAGDVQLISAGNGILHSEYNPSASERLRFLQIWIRPDRRGGAPRYQQQRLEEEEGVRLIASPDGEDGSLQIQQDARVYRLQLARQALTRRADNGRTYYLHLIRGPLRVNGMLLESGDGATLTGEQYLNLEAVEQAVALLFELP